LRKRRTLRALGEITVVCSRKADGALDTKKKYTAPTVMVIDDVSLLPIASARVGSPVLAAQRPQRARDRCHQRLPITSDPSTKNREQQPRALASAGRAFF